MDKHILLENYSILTELTKQQISITDLARYDSQLEDIEKLEDNKNLIKKKIDEINSKEIINLDSSQIVLLQSCIEELMSLTDTLHDKIQYLYNDDEKLLKQVSNQRKTLKAYGGLYNSDIVSYYLDEKK